MIKVWRDKAILNYSLVRFRRDKQFSLVVLGELFSRKTSDTRSASKLLFDSELGFAFKTFVHFHENKILNIQIFF